MKTLRKVTKQLSKIRFLRRFMAVVISAFAHFHTEVLIDDFDGNLFFYCKLDEHIASSIFWKGYHSEYELKTLGPLLQKDSVFIDIGANKGEFTVFAATRVPQGRVLSFEPTETNFKTLEKNIHKNEFKNVTLFNIGLSDSARHVSIYEPAAAYVDGTKNEGAFSIFPSAEAGKFLQEVYVDTLDEVVKRENLVEITVIKIDVEGAEPEVLRGMTETLKKFKPYLIIEINGKVLRSGNHAPSEIISFLDSFGYTYQSATSINPAVLKGAEILKYKNILCVPH